MQINSLSVQRKPDFETNIPSLIEKSLVENHILRKNNNRLYSMLSQWYHGISLQLCVYLQKLNDGISKAFSSSSDRYVSSSKEIKNNDTLGSTNSSNNNNDRYSGSTGTNTTMDKLNDVCSTFQNFLQIIDNAEKSRISVPDGNKILPAKHPMPPPSPQAPLTANCHISIAGNSNTMFSPMNMLARGYLGEEIALLVQYLEQHKRTICNAMNTLNKIRDEFKNNLQLQLNELSRKEQSVAVGVGRIRDFLIHYESTVNTPPREGYR